MVQDHVNRRVVRPGDVPALADALCDLLDDEPARQKLAARARETASRFSWAAIANQYLALCRQLIAHQGRSD